MKTKNMQMKIEMEMVQLGGFKSTQKAKVITHLLAFSGRNFHVTQRKSLGIQTRSVTIRKTLSS